MALNRLFYELRYLFSRPPWDTEITPPEVVAYINDAEVVPGRALDLGCGTGTNCVALAQKGWDAVGVDFSLLAILRARRRARRARVAVRFYQSDVTDLSFLKEPFDLVLDIGCLHGVSQERHADYAEHVARLTRPGGVYMLYAFTPRESRGQMLGLSPQMVRDLFGPALVVERQEGGEDPTGPSSAWYWLRRRN